MMAGVTLALPTQMRKIIKKKNVMEARNNFAP